MLKHLINKNNYIKQKIFEIYNIKINETHILFILSEEEQNTDTIEFLNKFQLPFIYFNNDENNYFKNKNHEYIKEFNLDVYTHFITNENLWNKAQLYKSDKNNEKKKEDNNNENYEDDDSSLESENVINDINEIIHNNCNNNIII